MQFLLLDLVKSGFWQNLEIFVSGFGDMDPETRKVHATMLVIRRTALIAVSTFLTFYIFYAVLGSGYDCEAEAKLVQEWAYAKIFLKNAFLGKDAVFF